MFMILGVYDESRLGIANHQKHLESKHLFVGYPRLTISVHIPHLFFVFMVDHC